MINPEISQKMILEYCHNHSEQNSSSIIELEKYENDPRRDSANNIQILGPQVGAKMA